MSETPSEPLPGAGAWVTWRRCNCHSKELTGVYASEIDALRVSNADEYTTAEFWPWGQDDQVLGLRTGDREPR